MAEWNVGQEVYVRRGRHQGRSGPCTVTKVGRKWVHLGDRVRFDKTSGYIDSSLGRVYVNEAAYNEECELRTAWRAFAKAVARTAWGDAPKGVRHEDIWEAARALGLELELEDNRGR